jgi:hypothetical protein
MVFMYFAGCLNEQEVKEKYRLLAKKLHPDMGGNSGDFIIMKNEYDYISGNSVSYPIATHSKAYPNTPSNSYQPKETVTNLDPDELERNRAVRYFTAQRVSDTMYNTIDGIKGLHPTSFGSQVSNLNKLDDLNIDHFKYLCFINGRKVHNAAALFKMYINNKMGW